MQTLLEHDATALAELVQRGDVTALELVEQSIAAIERHEPLVHALVHRQFERARAEAARDRSGGPFGGVPFLLKDFRAGDAGEPAYHGLRALRDARHTAPTDSALTTAFRQAGLIVMGRSNTPELALMGTTEPAAFGPTHNPWALGRSPGGSSGGSGAAVAAGYVPAAHANDIAGSIRIPAAHCGLVGMKPTTGAITYSEPFDRRTGLMTEGVITRSVRDTAGLLDAISIVPMNLRGALQSDPSHLSIGLWTTAFNGADVELECAAAAERTAVLLESLGHHVHISAPATLSDGELAAHMASVLAANNAAELAMWSDVLGRELGEADVEPTTWRLVEAGRSISGPALLHALGRLRELTQAATSWFDDFDVLLTPTTAEGPTALGAYVGDYRPGRGSAFTRPLNATGLPAISLPLGWPDDGTPRGVQLVAKHGREDLLIGLAAQLEQAAPWAHRRPTLGSIVPGDGVVGHRL